MWKATWRRWARSQRCSAVSGQRIAAELDAWLPTEITVTAYWPLAGEPDLEPIMDSPRRWLVPRVVGDVMTFHDADAETEVVAFGLRQPTRAAAVVPPQEIDAMVIPGLAFDRGGIRLGRGRGYYDRFLGDHAPEMTIGVIPASRLVEALPNTAHDQAVGWLVTESGVRSAQSG